MIDKPIYFLHIPKTSGTTVTEYINQLFSKEEVFPYQRWDLAYKEKKPSELALLIDDQHFKFYRGHFGFHHKFVKDKFVFTMLRNPVNRTISQYNHIIRYPEGNGWVHENFLKCPSESLKSILSDPTRANIITNVQTRYLSSSYNPQLDPKINTDFLYDISPQFIASTARHPQLSLLVALQRLICFDFFGLQEYHEESMLMLARKLNIKAPLLTERKQYFGNESFSSQVDTETQNLLFYANSLDNKLYAIARYILERRMLDFINHHLKTKLSINNYLSNRKNYLDRLQEIVLK